MASITEIIQKTNQVRKIKKIAEIQISLSFFFIAYIPLRNLETSPPLFFSYEDKQIILHSNLVGSRNGVRFLPKFWVASAQARSLTS